MNIPEATVIALTEQERCELISMIRSPKTEHGIVERARIVLLAAEGRSMRPAKILRRGEARTRYLQRERDCFSDDGWSQRRPHCGPKWGHPVLSGRRPRISRYQYLKPNARCDWVWDR